MLALGHSHPEVVEVVQRQVPLLITALDFPTELKDEFITAQLSLLPEAMRERTKIQFCGPAGANAVDAALKLCKTATGRVGHRHVPGRLPRQHAQRDGAHRARLAEGARREHDARRALLPVPVRDAHRALGGDPETLGERCLEYFERALKDPLGGIPQPAAVIMEVVQGEGGVIPAPTEFVQGVRRVTRELDIPLIVDEIQSGCGRTAPGSRSSSTASTPT